MKVMEAGPTSCVMCGAALTDDAISCEKCGAQVR